MKIQGLLRQKALRTALKPYTFDAIDSGTDMDYHGIITLEPGKRSGKPTIRGLRVTVYDVLDYLASGMTPEDILRDLPSLTREDIQACLSFAADRERKVTVVVE